MSSLHMMKDTHKFGDAAIKFVLLYNMQFFVFRQFMWKIFLHFRAPFQGFKDFQDMALSQG